MILGPARVHLAEVSQRDDRYASFGGEVVDMVQYESDIDVVIAVAPAHEADDRVHEYRDEITCDVDSVSQDIAVK